MSLHDTHCCKTHGCKYGDEDCPVVLGVEDGIICEDCMSSVAGLVLLKSRAVSIAKSGTEVTIMADSDKDALAIFEWLTSL